MPTITIELAEASFASIASRLSVREMKTLAPSQRIETLQRLFLYIEDQLKLNAIPASEIQLALLAAGGQSLVDENREVPIEDASKNAMNFFVAFVKMTRNMGLREAELSMLYAGAAATLQFHGRKLTRDVLEVLHKESAE